MDADPPKEDPPNQNPLVDATFDGIEFIAIKHGCFEMGSEDGDEDEKPVHKVCISRDFYLGKTEVTQAQFKSVVVTIPTGPLADMGDNKPAISFLQYDRDVLNFIKKLNEKSGGQHYRLPTEAEWEYAARAGTTTKYSFGDASSDLKEYAWIKSNSGGMPHEVATKKPNPWGLYDMYGNALECTQDYYHKDYYGKRIKKDPVNREFPNPQVHFQPHVFRGGSWNSKINSGIKSGGSVHGNLGSADRVAEAISGFRFSLGFRLVREP